MLTAGGKNSMLQAHEVSQVLDLLQFFPHIACSSFSEVGISWLTSSKQHCLSDALDARPARAASRRRRARPCVLWCLGRLDEWLRVTTAKWRFPCNGEQGFHAMESRVSMQWRAGREGLPNSERSSGSGHRIHMSSGSHSGCFVCLTAATELGVSIFT